MQVRTYFMMQLGTLPAEIGLRSTKVPIEISSGVDEENSMAWVTDV